MKRFLLLLVMMLAFSAPASGQLYEWIDDSGNTSFTDNPEHIPARYRNRATVREGDMGGQPATPGKSAVQPEPYRSKPEYYDGKTLSWWQKAYSDRLQQLETEKGALARLQEEQNIARRKMITLGRWTVDRAALGEKISEVAAKEARVKDLEKELDEFRAYAERSGVSVDMMEGGSR